jgi:hypothetical protein
LQNPVLLNTISKRWWGLVTSTPAISPMNLSWPACSSGPRPSSSGAARDSSYASFSKFSATNSPLEHRIKENISGAQSYIEITKAQFERSH